MSEKIGAFEGPPSFEVGSLVKLRDNLEESVLDALSPEFLPGIVYKVYHLSSDVEGQNLSVYIGPPDCIISDNFEDLSPEEILDKYSDILPISTKHLALVGN